MSTYTWKTFKQKAVRNLQEAQMAWQEMYAGCFFFYNFSLLIWMDTFWNRFIGNKFMYIWSLFHFRWYTRWFKREHWIVKALNDPKKFWRAFAYLFVTGIWPSSLLQVKMLDHATRRWRFPLIDWYIRRRNPNPIDGGTKHHQIIEVFDLVEEFFPWSNDEMFYFFRSRYADKEKYPDYESIRTDIRELCLQFEEVAFNMRRQLKHTIISGWLGFNIMELAKWKS
jgi:hypothetical protein